MKKNTTKNNKNGFTLVELLAVIVVLAIILVIAIPNVTRLIENSKEGSFEKTVLLTYDAIKIHTTQTSFTTGNIADLPTLDTAEELEGTWSIDDDGVILVCNMTNGKYSISGCSEMEDVVVEKGVVVVIADNDSDGLSDAVDPDDDNDSYLDLDEIALGTDPNDAGDSPVQTPTSCFTYDGTITTKIVAFDNITCTDTDIVIPDNTTEIGNTAFANKNITSVIFPNTLTSIGEQSFADNPITTINIPSQITIIEWATFADNNLMSVTIPNGVTTIKEYAFILNALTSVLLPESLVVIEPDAFTEQGTGNSSYNIELTGDETYPGLWLFDEEISPVLWIKQ